MAAPTVSVLMPFLNSQKFIVAAIESVFAQTFDDWELLLIDDGSTDDSTRIAHKFIRLAPDKVRYLEHPGHRNRGISASLNLGFRSARGRYIALLDSDDVWLPEKLRRQLAIFDLMPDVGMVCGASKYWYGWTNTAEDRARDHVVSVGAPADSVVFPPQMLTLLYPLGNGPSPCPSSLVVRREVFRSVGGFEDTFSFFYTDQPFLAKVYLATPIFVAGAYYDLYRQHAASSVALVRRRQYHAVRHRFLCWLETYLSDAGARGSDAWNILQKALWRYRHPFFFTLARAPTLAFQLLCRPSGLTKRR